MIPPRPPKASLPSRNLANIKKMFERYCLSASSSLKNIEDDSKRHADRFEPVCHHHAGRALTPSCLCHVSLDDCNMFCWTARNKQLAGRIWRCLNVVLGVKHRSVIMAHRLRRVCSQSFRSNRSTLTTSAEPHVTDLNSKCLLGDETTCWEHLTHASAMFASMFASFPSIEITNNV